MHRRNIDREIRRSVRERHSLHQRCIRINHRGSDFGAALIKRLLERFDRAMRCGLLHEYLGRPAPNHYQPVCTGAFLEIADVGPKLLREIHLRLARLDVMTIQLLHIVAIEDSLARLHRLEKRLYLVEQLFLENACLTGGGVHVVFKDVPTGENEVVEIGERNKFADLGRPAVSAFAQTHSAHLR